MAAWNEASVRSDGLRNSSDSTLPRSAAGSGCLSSRLASSSRAAISSLAKSARSLNAFMCIPLTGSVSDRLERLREPVDVFWLQYERCENAQHMRVAAGTGKYVVLE